MSEEIEMTVDEIGHRQRKRLLGFVIAWSVWQVTRIVGDFTDDGRHLGPVRMTFLMVQLLSWMMWGFYLFSMMHFRRRLNTRPDLLAALGDELFQQTRLRAALVAFGCTLGCQAALVLVSFFWPLTATEGANITILVGVTSFLGIFLWMERE